ncbi:MAG TPA: hypothetical protein VF637_13400, partial [Sphingomicrobium sp.]
MLVYGDHKDIASPAAAISAIASALDAVQSMEPGMGRHAALASAFIESGRLLQGVADAHFANDGADRPIGATDALRDFVHALARATIISWDSRGSTVPVLPAVPEIGGEQVELKVPEGYAFYAVFPEAFAEAARKLVLSAPARVIGIRSIGASLGAIAA